MSSMPQAQEKFSETLPQDLPISPAKAGMIVFLSIFAFMIIGFSARVLAEAIWGEVEWNSPFMIVELLIALPAVLIVRHYHYSVAKAFRLNPISVPVVFWSLLAGVSLAVLGDQLDRIIQIWFPMPAELLAQLELTFKTPHMGDFVFLLIIATVGAGVCEEMLFRGFLQRIFEKRLLLWSAIMLPALLFGVIHVLPWLVVQITIMGVVLGLIAWKTDSIYPTILIHAVNNLVAILFIRFSTPATQSFYLANDLVDPKIVLVAIAIFAFALVRIWRSGVNSTGKDAAAGVQS